MKRRAAVLLALAAIACGAIVRAQVRDRDEPPVATAAAQAAATRFGHVDVSIDVADAPLAVYQCEITATVGAVTLVGIEGGEHPAFREPPYYDPRALGQNRIVLGAFNTGHDLPRGRTRVARLMVKIAGADRPAYAANVVVAAGADGKPTRATISVRDSDAEGAQR